MSAAAAPRRTAFPAPGDGGGTPTTTPLHDREEVRRLVAATLLPGFEGEHVPEWAVRRLREGLAGICIFGPNIASRVQLAEVAAEAKAARPTALVAIDEEAGDVTRLYYDSGAPYPGNAVLGRIDDPDYTERIGRLVGEELRAIGITLDLAPDVDINSNPDNPVIGARSFGTTAERVAAHGAAWVRGVQSAGVAASPKHFPGHGDTGQDSHHASPVVDLDPETLGERELRPFAAAVRARAETVMTSHIRVPAIDADRPATLSAPILEGLLRSRLGYDGVIVTDALDMVGASGDTGIPEAAVRALAAGCDLLCIGVGNAGTDGLLTEIEEAVARALDEGRLDADRLRSAAAAVQALGERLADRSANIPEPAWDAARGEPELETAPVVAAFDIGDGADAWLREHRGDFAVARLETGVNIAIGTPPWGPFAHTAARPESRDARAFAAHPLHRIAGEEDVRNVLEAARPVVVIGRNNHLHPLARTLVDRLRGTGTPVLVVDMGWPADDRRYADVATFGASRLVGRALIGLLTGETAS